MYTTKSEPSGWQGACDEMAGEGVTRAACPRVLEVFFLMFGLRCPAMVSPGSLLEMQNPGLFLDLLNHNLFFNNNPDHIHVYKAPI